MQFRVRHGKESRPAAGPKGAKMSALSEAYPSAKIQWVKSPGRSAENDNKPVAELVAGVLADVKARGDAAVREYSALFPRRFSF